MFFKSSIVPLISKWQRAAMSLLLPWHCILCRCASDQPRDLCYACQQSLPWRTEQSNCHSCAIYLPADTPSKSNYCSRCLISPPNFDRTIALWDYQQLIVTAIHQLKFHHQLVWARLFGEMMAEVLAQQSLPQQIIPVPLHHTRLRQRGFNQTLEIARPIAKALSIPVNYSSCRRIYATAMQSQLPVKRRYANVKNAFQVTGKLPQYVAVIDDVMTSGHTVNELSHALRQAGVKRIDIWCCARAGQYMPITLDSSMN